MIWLALIVLLIAAALLAGIESALISVSRVRARHAADDGDKRAAKLAALLEQRQDLLHAAMTAHHFCSITAFAVIAVLCRRALGPWGILVAAVIGTPVFLIALELVPKALFRLFPFRLLRRLTLVLTLLKCTALPWRIFAGKKAPAQPTARLINVRSGVSALAENIISLKLLPENAAALLSRYAAFVNLHARDAVVPPDSAGALSAAMPLDFVMQAAAKNSRRHHAVFDESGGGIGFLDAAALPPNPPHDRFARQFTQPAPHVAPDDTALHCLKTLRKSAAPLALVKDCNSIISLDSLLSRLMNISDMPRATSAPR